MPDFDYRKYFDRIQDLKRVQIPAGNVNWIEKYDRPDTSPDVVLYLGCNILRTPHIAKQVVDVFAAADLDFVAVGGVQFCCGIVWDVTSNVQRGQGVSSRTVDRLESYGASEVVMWCPSCNVHFADAIEGRDGLVPRFDITHATRFLADLAAKGSLVWTKPVPRRVAIHSHVGRQGHAEGRRRGRSDREAVEELLSHVPGLEIVESIDSAPEMEYDCGAAVLKLSVERMRENQWATIERAVSLGVDEIVTISHACHREWCGANTDTLRFRNYITIVAEALGLDPTKDWLASLISSGSVDEMLETSRLAWTSYGLTEAEARKILLSYTASRDLTPH